MARTRAAVRALAIFHLSKIDRLRRCGYLTTEHNLSIRVFRRPSRIAKKKKGTEREREREARDDEIRRNVTGDTGVKASFSLREKEL